MPPRPTTVCFMRLIAQHKVGNWETVQIGAILELYQTGTLRATPAELGEMLRKIAPTHTTTILRVLKILQKKKTLSQKIHRLADVRRVATKEDRSRVDCVVTVVGTLASM